jgi:tetratricopeptide (TPR) repeat protein
MPPRNIIAGVLLLWSVTAAIAQTPITPQPQPFETPARIQELLKARDFARAEQEIKQELDRSPAWETGHLLLAQIYTQSGRYDLAERSAASAVRIRESLDGFMLLAVATMHMNRLNDSIGWLEKAARRRPDHAEIFKVLGLDYALGGTMLEAQKAFRKAVELDPANWEYHYLEGRAFFELGRNEASLGPLLTAVKLNSVSAKAWTALGQVQERTGNRASAEASYRKALDTCKSQPECAWPLLQLGFFYDLQGSTEQALAYFRRAVEARPQWARPHFYLGKKLAASGDLDGARKELEQAVSLDDTQSEYHYRLAQVYRQLGQPLKAGAHLARFRQLAKLQSKPSPGDSFTEP